MEQHETTGKLVELPTEGRQRVAISGVRPEISGGRFPVKRTVGERVVVEADAFADGHDAVRCALLFRPESGSDWERTWMQPLGNDRWRASFSVAQMGYYRYTVEAWIDPFLTWLRDMRKRVEAGRVERVDVLVGALLLEGAAAQAGPPDAGTLREWAQRLRDTDPLVAGQWVITEEGPARLMETHGERKHATRYEAELRVRVDRDRARFSAWYEMFPRSCASKESRPGTLRDCIELLPYVRAMGFDVLYLPPVHPIGRINRKGRNNTLEPGPDDVGSPWALGSKEGGHKSIHPDLGTIDDFRSLVAKTREAGIEIAMDLAFQCAPDHPYVKEHPEWFRARPDGTVQCAENPPKKYQDIYPFNFETEAWASLWEELRSVVQLWIDQGVRIFRVDNPHTKPFRFWEWLIDSIQARHPEVIFLAEAFTRPRVMERLAKVGFTQSYTYFTWRNTKYELTEYVSHLTTSGVREYMRPNFWPNTPDILPEFLQTGGRPAFAARLLLAATLAASYGIYGPAFELGEDRPREFGGEEYLDSEKYEIRRWDRDAKHSLRPLIARVNRIRRENPALQRNDNLRFHPTDNEQVICYSKSTDEGDNVVVCAISLDPYHTHSAWIELPIGEFGIPSREAYQVHDLLSDARYLWHGPRNYVQIDPQAVPGHILRIRRRVRTERDFDYYL